MATRKTRTGNLSKKLDTKPESSDEEIDATAISDEEINVKDDPEEEWDEHNESSEGQANTSFEDDSEEKDTATERSSPQGTLFLDVLAQVASDRLETDPGPSSGSSAPKRVTNMSKRSLLNMDFLHLDQIRTLSPKFLVNLFAEMNSNEITRNYSYTCYIIPEKCNSTYSSFGSEIRARELIKSHLQKHVGELVKLKAANQGFSFIAETVVAKKKREIAEKSMRKRKAWNVGVNKISKKAPLKPPSKGKPATNPKKLTGIKPPKGRKSSSDEVHVNVSIVKKPRDVNSSSAAGTQSQAPEGDFPMILHDDDFTIPIKAHAIDEESGEEPSEFTVEHSKADGEWDIIEDKAKVPFKRTGRNVERNEKIIWDILCGSQPYHDHSYTTVFGKRKAGQAFEEMDMLEMDEEIDEENRQASRTGGLKCALPSQIELESNTENTDPVVMKIADKIENKLHVPMVRIEYSGGNESSALISSEIMGHTVNRPYPPMPKSDLAHQGRIPMMEEPVSSSEDEPQTATPTTTASSIVSPSKKRYRRKVAEGTLEWEKRLALKCIRELRSRKKEENNGLICKICKDKTFTATATLMYHYRSHAGIKPFVCLICNTTFTRQHSLNYHMLIHNNQSRFTCVDCGRKFRHPSHFKEHLRRHTGETPFHCMDCPLRFKTRNTYKRHLRTRHGKLLTANGIRILPEEEFLKIRSRYAKKGVNEEDEEFDDEEEDEAALHTKYPQSQDQDDDIDPDAEIDLEGLDSDKESSKIDDNVPITEAPITVQSTFQQVAQQQIIHQQASQPSAIYVPISQGSTVGVPIAISTMARSISAIAVPIQVSASSLSTVAFPIKMPLDQNLATVAVPVNVPADQNLSALSDTSASTKLLQLCSQVVQQEVG